MFCRLRQLLRNLQQLGREPAPLRKHVADMPRDNRLSPLEQLRRLRITQSNPESVPVSLCLLAENFSVGPDPLIFRRGLRGKLRCRLEAATHRGYLPAGSQRVSGRLAMSWYSFHRPSASSLPNRQRLLSSSASIPAGHHSQIAETNFRPSKTAEDEPQRNSGNEDHFFPRTIYLHQQAVGTTACAYRILSW